ncbi:bifunctional metallophosphatase/5'-nucleotidase [Kroppenstedtia pulmonis]|uniref:Bifunctional metallophosphatase/5'-nucleotidase n=1 Tax=Kroppenstedtia pulmonis TaxID=1380685 RepID=A0A7D3XLF9_9BACL|nr:bifunctional UDP-sugar hydrolase/5'-nucleotidase [Kroppenstedtia pulmonis]QKG83669.1 bifunctional metallophosphatase/5'-nucleotidase [Kroppenstedtia pulmonis]
MDSSVRVHIVHTNDIHSHFEEMLRIHTLIHQLRQEAEQAQEPCFLVDVGDHMDRVRMETEGTDGLVNRGVMDAAGYQMITLGNNELLTFSKQELNHLFHEAPFEVLAANVWNGTGEQPDWIHKWSFRQAHGIRIAFTGVTISLQDIYRQLGWEVSDPIRILEKEIPRIRREADAVVLLSHLGWGNDCRLAQEVPGIDLILGSHTHHLLEAPKRIGDTWVVAAGKFGQHVGHTILHFVPETGSLKKVEGRCLPTETVAPDVGIQRLIQDYRHQSNEVMAQPVTELDWDLPIDWYQESPLGNLLADGLLHWTGGDCAMVNAGQLLGGLKAGQVTKARIHQICPHPINPCRMVLKGEQIRLVLEKSLLKDYQQMEIRGFGFRGKQLGILNLSGMEVNYVPDAPPLQRISHVVINGKDLVDEAMYQVATIDMFTFGVGYKDLREGMEQKFFLPEFLRHILTRQLTRPQAVYDSFRPRWRDKPPCMRQ